MNRTLSTALALAAMFGLGGPSRRAPSQRERTPKHIQREKMEAASAKQARKNARRAAKHGR